MKSYERKPMILFFAGPNGSGKSTITDYFETVGEDVTQKNESIEDASIEIIESRL